MAEHIWRDTVVLTEEGFAVQAKLIGLGNTGRGILIGIQITLEPLVLSIILYASGMGRL
jgi:hypothetical protein